MADSYPDRKNASGLWSINEISKNKIAEGNWPGNFGNRGMFAGGIAPSSVDTVDFITITTAGDASDFGNLQTADRYGCTGSGSTTRGLFCGGGTNNNVEDTIDYFTISTTGNGTDFGNLTGSNRSAGAFGNQTKCFNAGGSSNSDYVNIIEFVTIANLGN